VDRPCGVATGADRVARRPEQRLVTEQGGVGLEDRRLVGAAARLEVREGGRELLPRGGERRVEAGFLLRGVLGVGVRDGGPAADAAQRPVAEAGRGGDALEHGAGRRRCGR
jgi:hypothetical protein